ncbi:MAG: SecY-interacting protein Syd [Pseudomonadales bacterium]|nr:SecY-interacting protein Syd [Pseudomonadales bacterium]
MNSVKEVLAQLFNEAIALTDKGYFEVNHDEEWPSACILNEQVNALDKISRWRPTPQTSPVNFDGLANALGDNIHPDVIEYFSSFWSGSLQAKTKEGPLSLIQLWNNEDFDRLIENLIGHLFAKQRAKLPFTIFFATTDPDSELFLSIENSTGKILLEEPGRPPIKEIDTDLVCFLKRVTPVNTLPEIY